MDTKHIVGRLAKWSAAGIGIASVSYATYVGLTWFRYGHAKRANASRSDPVLELFMSDYEVADRQSVYIAAPAEVVIATAKQMNLESSAIIRGIFRGREWILHSKSDDALRPNPFLERMKSLGWGVLAELPGREIVM